MASDSPTRTAPLALGELADAYAAAVDARDPDALCSCFLPGGLLVVVNGSGTEQEYRGHAELHGVIPLLARFAVTVHHVTTRTVVAQGGLAHATVACVAHHISPREDGARDFVMHLRYEDRCRQADDGGWRFDERIARVLFTERRDVALT